MIIFGLKLLIVFLVFFVILQRVRIAGNADRCNSYVLSVCLSCLSVTFRCFVKTNEDTIVRFSASGRKIILVSGK